MPTSNMLLDVVYRIPQTEPKEMSASIEAHAVPVWETWAILNMYPMIVIAVGEPTEHTCECP